MRKISLIVYDFDGVLTDNRVWVNQDGVETVACNRSDGWWMGEIRKLGIEQFILSSEANPVVSARGKKLNIPVIQGVADKRAAFARLLEEKNLPPSEVIFIGNDMNDAGCFEIAGHTFCPEDSHPKICKMANVVLPVKGGMGLVRLVYDWITA